MPKGIYIRTEAQLLKMKESGYQKGHKINLGRKRPDMEGSNHFNWKNGISAEPDYHKRMNKEWIEKNRGYKCYLNNQRRAQKIQAEGSHTFGEWELLKKQYGYTCPCCGRKEPEMRLTEDHIIPLIKGGSDYIENIQPLCRSCNSIKHTKTIKYNIISK